MEQDSTKTLQTPFIPFILRVFFENGAYKDIYNFSFAEKDADKNKDTMYFDYKNAEYKVDVFTDPECKRDAVCQFHLERKYDGFKEDYSKTMVHVALLNQDYPEEKSNEQESVITVEMNDVTRPSYYNKSGIEVWDVINAFCNDLPNAQAFYAGNAIKYLLRWHHKNGVEDLKKAKVYIDKLIEERGEKS